MELGLLIARSVGAAILGIVAFVCFLSFMLVSHFTGKALDAQFYADLLVDHDTYNRIYSEVLLDQQVRRSTQELTRNVAVISHEDLVNIAREAAPPGYIQAQVEDNLRRGAAYFKGEGGTADLGLELWVDLGPPLARVKPAIFAEVDRRIDALETLGPDPNLDLTQQLVQARDVTQSSLRSLAAGQMPEAVPSIELIPGPFRNHLFNVLLPGLINDPGLDPRARAGLAAHTEELRGEFVAGDTHQFLKVAARAALEPFVDDAVAGFRRNLDSEDRLDLIQAATRNSNTGSEASLRARMADLRDQVRRARTLGITAALVVGIAAVVGMVLIYLPSVTNALRWPGLTLLLIGLVLFLLGRVLENTLPARLNQLVDGGAPALAGLPPSAAALIAEIIKSAGQRAVEGLAAPMLLLVVLGAVLLGASLLVPLLRRYVPGIR